ncbi:hypothetical protein GF324_01990 [bacterium]|nr:hypothetical protein [bacterium]
MSRITRWTPLFAALLLTVLMLLIACSESDPINADGRQGDPEEPTANQPPETYLYLDIPDSLLPDTSNSVKHLRWWGEDSDGRVIAYRHRWGKRVDDSTVDWIDTVWQETTEETGSFVVPIREALATFTFQIKAVDDDSTEDETPAEIDFPVFNTRPSINFRLSSNPLTVPDTFYTFTTRTFVWDATDIDGNETIAGFYYALNPEAGDTAWQHIEAPASSVTLRDIEPGSSRFFLKCYDLAGFESNTVHFPDTTVTTDPAVWVVKDPAPGGRLIVDDFRLDTQLTHQLYYISEFERVFGAQGDEFSVWRIGEELPYSSVDITETLMMFDRVYWYAYYGGSSVSEAFSSVFTFINGEDKRLVLSSMVIDTSMINGMGIADSSYGLGLSRLGNSAQDTVYLDPESLDDLPRLTLDQLIGRPPIGLIPDESADVLYRYDESPLYDGNPVVGVRRSNKSYTLIAVPLYVFQGGDARIGETIQVLFEQ